MEKLIVLITEFLLLFILFLFLKRIRSTFSILIFLQMFSFFAQYLVGYHPICDSVVSFLNILFISANTILIILPWSYGRISIVTFASPSYVLFGERILNVVLLLNLIINILILIVVLIFIPDIASFKAENSFYDLYDSIPYFANLFRYAYVSQNLGILAIPLFFYYLGTNSTFKCIRAIILSSSSLVSGFAFYSRAQILTYVLVFISYYLLIQDSLRPQIQTKIWRIIKKVFFIVGFLFILITIVRFSAMDYYADRIPSDSLIQDPIVYSIVDYASQGYPKGLVLLDEYDSSKNLEGEEMFRTVYQFLAFFGIVSWDSDLSTEKIASAYNYDGGAFHGYTCQMVYNFGYLITFIIGVSYFLYVRGKLYAKRGVSIETLLSLILLLVIPLVSIFYCGFGLLYFPIVFMVIVKVLYFLRNALLVKK